MYIDHQRSWFLHGSTHHGRCEGGLGGVGAIVGILLEFRQQRASIAFYVNYEQQVSKHCRRTAAFHVSRWNSHRILCLHANSRYAAIVLHICPLWVLGKWYTEGLAVGIFQLFQMSWGFYFNKCFLFLQGDVAFTDVEGPLFPAVSVNRNVTVSLHTSLDAPASLTQGVHKTLHCMSSSLSRALYSTPLTDGTQGDATDISTTNILATNLQSMHILPSSSTHGHSDYDSQSDTWNNFI